MKRAYSPRRSVARYTCLGLKPSFHTKTSKNFIFQGTSPAGKQTPQGGNSQEPCREKQKEEKTYRTNAPARDGPSRTPKDLTQLKNRSQLPVRVNNPINFLRKTPMRESEERNSQGGKPFRTV
jgi:hypothetical protein